MSDLMFRSRGMLDVLTDKHVEVLDQLILHKTNKEIALALDIAPATVEQRIATVREKWGTENRNATARVYGELIGVYGKPLYGSPGVDDGAEPHESLDPDLPLSPHFQLNDFLARPEVRDWTGGMRGPEALDARFGKIWRIAAIPVLAILIGMVLIWGLAFADQLGELL